MEIVFQSPPGVAAQPGDPDGSFPLQRFVGKQHVPQLLAGHCLISWQKNVIAGLLSVWDP